MAKQSNVYVIGRKGNVVGSTWKGIAYLRFQPDNINQTKATKQSGENMGKASKIGAAFRHVFAPVLPQPKDRDMQNDFTGVIKKWLQTKPFEQSLPSTVLPYIESFDFNASADINGAFRVPLKLKTNEEEQLVLQMPAFVPKEKISAPCYTKAVDAHIIIATYSIASFSIIGSFQTALSIAYNNDTIPAQLFTAPFFLPKESLTTVLVALQYIAGKKGEEKIVQKIGWMPCGIVGGWVR
jgi:hypothetical protein